jgi:hypothetical protein
MLSLSRLVIISKLKQNKTRALDEVHSKLGERDGDLEQSLREKEEELEIYKSGMDQTLLELNELRMVSFKPLIYHNICLKHHRMVEIPIKL